MMDEDDVISNKERDISDFDKKSADLWMDYFGKDEDDAEVTAFDDVGDDEAFARMIEEMLNLPQQNLDTDDIRDIQGTEEQVIKRVRKKTKEGFDVDRGRWNATSHPTSAVVLVQYLHCTSGYSRCYISKSFASVSVFHTMKSSKSSFKILKLLQCLMISCKLYTVAQL